jgi:hypothetical protein
VTPPRVALLVIHDGRGLKQQAVESFHANARRVEVATIIEVDDTQHELGFCGAIREGWARLRAVHAEAPFDYVFHLEEDWLLLAPIDVSRMAALLAGRQYLCQVAMRRGPINDREMIAGGVVEQWPHEVCVNHAGDRWIEHSATFTTNPCLYRRGLLARDWPEAPECEGRFGFELMREGWRSAYWGPPGDAGILVEHVGIRGGTGY